MSKIITLLKKDFLLELRQQHTFFGILLYVASTIFVLYLTLPESNSAEGGRGSRQKKHEHAPPEIDSGALQGALQARMPRSTRLTIARAAWQQASTVKMRTDDPALALTVLAEVAQGLGASLQASVVEADPLALAVRRVIQDVHR